MSLIGRIHGGYIYNRRVRVLCEHLEKLLPRHAKVLDTGCGDGTLARLILQRRPDIGIQGIDVLVRPQSHIPVERFDGRHIPYGEATFDVVMCVDVPHHTDDPMILMREAMRVARHAILIKDHTLDGFFAGPTLRLIDWIGNARHGVVLPYNYRPRQRWCDAFDALGLKIGAWKQDLRLYPRPASWLFDRSLHFVARLDM